MLIPVCILCDKQKRHIAMINILLVVAVVYTTRHNGYYLIPSCATEQAVDESTQSIHRNRKQKQERKRKRITPTPTAHDVSRTFTYPTSFARRDHHCHHRHFMNHVVVILS